MPRSNHLFLFLFLVLFIVCPERGYTQLRLTFDNLGVEDGLSSSNVNSIYQDRSGFIWIGTQNGVNRYDGRQIVAYAPDAEHPGYPIRGLQFREDNAGNLWINGYDALALFHPGSQEFEFFSDVQDGRRIMICYLYIDKRGTFWVGTQFHGLMRFDPETKRFLSFAGDFDKNLPPRFVLHILEDSFGSLWFSYPNGLYQFQWKDSSLHYHPFQEDFATVFDDRMIRSLYEDSRKDLWVGTRKGLFRYDREAETFSAYPLNTEADKQTQSIGPIGEDADGRLWIGRYGWGLHVLDLYTGEMTSFPADRMTLGTLNSANFVSDLYRDSQGGMWFGTNDAGVFYSSRYRKPYTIYQHITGVPGNTGNNGAGYSIERRDGKIWMTTLGGLELFDPIKERFEKIIDIIGRGMTEDREDRIWVGSWGQGLTRIDPGTNTVVNYRADPTEPGSLPGNSVAQVFVDREETLWISVWLSGLYRYDSEKRIFQHVPLIPPNGGEDLGFRIRGLISQDRAGNLWIGARGGLIKLDRSKQGVAAIYPVSTCFMFQEDANGLLWLAAANGFHCLDPRTGKLRHWTEKDGLIDNVVTSILMDDRGHAWLGTQNGLSRFNLDTEEFRNFDASDGLPGNIFGEGAALKTRSGEFYFGLNKGLLRFHPDSLLENPHQPPVVITDFQIDNRSVPVRGSLGDTLEHPSPLLKHISYTGEIRLNWRQNDISFAFAALNYLDPEKNLYQYRLENFDKGWISTDAQRPYAHYTNLDPGRYLFRVIGSNNDGIWNQDGAALHILITPPWYWNTWSKILYGLLAMGMITLFYRYQLKRRLALAEAGRLRELDQVKTRLYTNISHEFRTPLTVIQGVTGHIESVAASKKDEALATNARIVKRNSVQLLNLVNQLLELRKLESGNLPVHLVQGDIVGYLKVLLESFHSLAESKDLQLHFLPQEQEIWMDYDPEKIRHIMSNLLSNAIKFTPAGGAVTVQVITGPSPEEGTQPMSAEQSLSIRVADTGIGIPPGKLSHIFDRFYQVDDASTRRAEGTGIGLTLTKELVRLLEGDIRVESEPGAGTAFDVVLPIRHTAPVVDKMPQAKSISAEAAVAGQLKNMNGAKEGLGSGEQERPLVLLVEDNRDVAGYIQSCLQGRYRTEIAGDGRVGIEKAMEIIPDLIISDVMMPEKDGFELCHILKHDLRTSHIPIVLLTAKADIESKLAGLRRGADAYLTKPFHEEELQVRLAKLLELRQRLQKKYGSEAYVSNLAMQAEESDTPFEDEFIANVIRVIEEHLDDHQLDVPTLCRKVGLSRTALHNKLKALTGKSTTEFIRFIRLSKARQLLLTTDLHVGEIAFRTGFQHPNYFSRRFKEQFVLSPTAYREINGG